MSANSPNSEFVRRAVNQDLSVESSEPQKSTWQQTSAKGTKQSVSGAGRKNHKKL